MAAARASDTGTDTDRSSGADIGTDDLDAFAEIAFAARGSLTGVRPGRHRSRALGAGGVFAGLAPLIADPDPRRIDLRASLRDPFGTLWVRRHRRTVDAEVVVILDVSASMGFCGTASRPDLARTLVGGLAHAAARSADRFGLILAGEQVEPDPLMPPTRRRGLGPQAAGLVAATGTHGVGAAGLIEAADLLPRRRAVVVLVSDFTFEEEVLEDLLGRLAIHDVRPVVLRDSALDRPDPAFGLVDLQDLETGHRRLVLMRPALAARWQAEADDRRRRLADILAVHGLEPIEIVDQIDPVALFEALGAGGGAP
ncbi:DUF58 domain-containing protein [Methylobrevis pamukkalensis]|uniref:VWA domain containing CoxE-like protein n=1 Tax=Methylobrevis pamukkalensis TaxID=1439726 RepID=A0A1E3H661_9HYPH|nr:VWA domain-containing protein [Methylobrevis pamukkalensis]ODN71804.1 VWA domain containing CoxE-like protein [Methylobrevis pamukkalensis]